MPSLQIRNLPEDVARALAERARREQRSLAQQAVVELRRLLEQAAVDRRRQVLAVLRQEGPCPAGAMPDPVELLREDRDAESLLFVGRFSRSMVAEAAASTPAR